MVIANSWLLILTVVTGTTPVSTAFNNSSACSATGRGWVEQNLAGNYICVNKGNAELKPGDPLNAWQLILTPGTKGNAPLIVPIHSPKACKAAGEAWVSQNPAGNYICGFRGEPIEMTNIVTKGNLESN